MWYFGNSSAARGPGGEQLLHLSQYTRVYRRQAADGAGRVVCKELLGPKALQRFRQERRILERLAGLEGVPRLIPGNFPPCTIALEDCGDLSLGTLGSGGAWETPALLELSLRLGGILSALHRCGVAHRNLTPDNVLVPGAERRPVLIGFGLATTFAEERPGFVHHREIAGTLGYLAPEQTGRTGRSVDQRADLYSLGATLYRLATGRPPFEAGDPLQLIHDILTRVPTPPAALNARVPEELSGIIARLLEKEPDRRYQSAQGVLHDLYRLGRARELEGAASFYGLWGRGSGQAAPLAPGRGASGSFSLGERDFPPRLSPPSRLIGREREIAALGDAFDAALNGAGGGVLVAGAAGVGKTALIGELRPMVTARRGFFVAGKFDQYRRDLASDAVHQAFRALGRLLLAEPEAELSLLREKMLHSLGPNAGLITALNPEFATILGAAPEVAADDPLKAGGRLIQTALDLLRAVVSRERPLVMVIDDLQWGTATPIGLVDALLTDQGMPGLLLVCAYREAELDSTHPQYPLLSRWQRLAAAPPLLRLANLPPAGLGLLIGEMLRLQPEEAERLAEAVGARTDGNPYDTVELINALRRDGALVPSGDGWSWEAATIRRYIGQGDVVQLLTERVDRLPPQAQELVGIIACLGGEVEIDLLQGASDLSAAAVEVRLAPPLEDGLLVLEPGGNGAVRFRHDRVQQAAYGRLEPEARRVMHLAIGRRLAQLPEFSTVAAEQYLPALDALEDPLELRRVVALLRSAAAGERRVDYAVAQRFLGAAWAQLKKVAGEDDEPELAALETELHTALFCLGRLGEADELYRSLERRRTGRLELVEAACVQISSLTNRARPGDAVALGLDFLRRLGIAVPRDEEVGGEVDRGLELFYRWVRDHNQADDFGRPEASNPRALAAARIINRLMPAAFFCNQAMMTWLVLESQSLWSESGPCEGMIGPLSHAGFVLIALRQDYRSAFDAVRHALAVSEARGYPSEPKARFLFALSASPWFEPLEEGVRQAQLAQESLLRGGDMQLACHTHFVTVPLLLDCAPRLESWAAETESGIAFARRTGNEHAVGYFMAHLQLARALRGETEAPGSFTDGCFDEAAHLAGVGKDPFITAHFHIYRALSAAIFRDATALLGYAATAMALLPGIPANYPTALAHLLQGLALAERARKGAPDQRAPTLAELEGCRDWLARRAADAPGNFGHLLKLVQAEAAWAAGEFQPALSAFDAALNEVESRQRPWHRALITERAALFHLAHGLEHVGNRLLFKARCHYEEWGASAKVRQLERSHPTLRGPATLRFGGEQRHTISADAIDMLAILRASQALSSETSLERLRAQVAEVLGAMTGATAVTLVLWKEEARDWYVLTAALDDPLPVPITKAADRDLLPISVLRYAERTREPLLVEDAKRDDRFRHDPYLQALDCCSLLAVPILNHGVARAILLLENRLSRGAFGVDRLDGVQLIAGQLAVSLENALLYEKLEERVRDRTRELQEAQSELVTAARQAGMAEIASNVLHNVGNVLNSVNISAEVVTGRMRASRVTGLLQAVRLMNEHPRDLGEYLSRDAKGKLLPGYLEKLARALAAEQQEIVAELSQLSRSVDHIKDIVATQQSFAGAASFVEPVRIGELVQDALRINAEALARHEVTVVQELVEVQPLLLDKGRLLQILVNLVSNAKHAMAAAPDRPRRLTLRVELVHDSLLRIRVSDQGEGIAPQNLARIFEHGFTTRRGGHGFGLHSCALAAQEMGGTLTARSEGPGKGASFTLELPIKRESTQGIAK